MATADLYDIRTTCTVRIGGVVHPPGVVALVRESDARSLVAEGRAFFVPKGRSNPPGKASEPGDVPLPQPEPAMRPEAPMADAKHDDQRKRDRYRDKSWGPRHRR